MCSVLLWWMEKNQLKITAWSFGLEIDYFLKKTVEFRVLRKKVIFVIFPILLISCAPSKIDWDYNYMPVDGKGAYFDRKITDSTYEIMFKGRGYTRIETVLDYWDRRAGELCETDKYESEIVIGYGGKVTPEVRKRVNSIITIYTEKVAPYAKGVAVCES